MKMQTWEMFCETCGMVTKFKRPSDSIDIGGWICDGLGKRTHPTTGETRIIEGCGKAQTALN